MGQYLLGTSLVVFNVPGGLCLLPSVEVFIAVLVVLVLNSSLHTPTFHGD